MALRYYSPTNNFGDALNRSRFWEGVVPAFAELATRFDVFGIGTLLSRRFVGGSARKPKVVLGSGCGYHTAARADASWRVAWVRGPLTAAVCDVRRDDALTDPAYLLPFARPDLPWRSHARSGTVLMPHVDSDARADFRRLAQLLGFKYVAPTDPLEAIVAAFGAAQRVVTESLHGAILADTLRVPWTPLVTHKRINTFKWRDYCASIDVPYCPIVLSSALIDSAPSRRVTRWRHRGEVALARRLPSLDAFSPLAPWRVSTATDYARSAEDIDAFVTRRASILSCSKRLAMLQHRMLERANGLARTVD
jgi:succinoglycan biosynthesis protein ExoV